MGTELLRRSIVARFLKDSGRIQSFRVGITLCSGCFDSFASVFYPVFYDPQRLLGIGSIFLIGQ